MFDLVRIHNSPGGGLVMDIADFDSPAHVFLYNEIVIDIFVNNMTVFFGLFGDLDKILRYDG